MKSKTLINIQICEDTYTLGKAAAEIAAQTIRTAIITKGKADIILATGTSQFETLRYLLLEDIDWSKVSMFHLDEYIGLSENSGASFRKYLKERFISKVALKAFYLINGEADPVQECERLNELISQTTIDVALVGIGENGHLAFNDPPANFDTTAPFIIVDLDEACRLQQFNEGWFPTIDDVPKQAISMSIKQICASAVIVCSVPDARKSKAVSDCLDLPVSNMRPASILQRHQQCYLYLDKQSSALLMAN